MNAQAAMLVLFFIGALLSLIAVLLMPERGERTKRIVMYALYALAVACMLPGFLTLWLIVLVG